MNYPSIRIEGAILSPDILDKLEESAGQKPSDFDFAPNAKVKDEIARAWADAQDYWRIFQRRLEGVKSSTPATSETRNLWIAPLLGLLGYQLEYQKRGVELNGKLYAISHRVINRGQTPIHIIDWREPAGLDRKPENATLRMSAHGLVQEYLNLHDELYGVVTNGRVLRLLRDSSRLVKLTYLEFDLERIFSDGLFADFAIFYRLLHATRLPAAPEVAAESLIEKYHQDSLDSGTRIRQGLSRAVEQAIREFANGFLDHPDNDTLRQLVRDEKIKPEAYYHHLLNLIYRLLFLLVIEERDLVYPAQTPRSQRQVYDDYYSLQRLRRLAEKRYLADRRYHDLWRALQTTFALFSAEGRGKKLGLTPLAGDLFHPDAIGPFNECTLGNDVLLGCLRALGLYQHPDKRQMLRVNYAALNVEELGSVYEGLLKLVPAFERVGSKTAFLLRPGADDTQSHYTADDLVQPLLKHSLDYLIAEKLEGAREIASKASGEIASKASREIGSGEIGRKKNDNQFLSGSYGVGEGDAVGGNLLPANPSISERGDVWIDLADSAGGGLDSGEYSRGVGARGDSRIYPLSEDSAGQPKGIGNTPDSQSTGRTGGRKVSVSNSGSVRRSGADDPLPDWFFTAQAEWDRERDREREIGSKKDRDVSPSRSSLPPYSLLAEKALLSLRVADISCGSGHILLAAARRIAVALAAARTGEDQPSPTAFRTAVRDVIRHCIYGVDLNPLAVELCKVALWLEAHNPGEPLNFLDHHIKCGNAIVGYVRPDDVARRGVPDEAFTTMTGDDKQVAATLRKRNKAEQKQKAQTVFEFAPARQQQFADVLRRWREIVTLPENTPAEISAKKEAYNAYAHSGEAWRLNQLAAIPIAQFYLPKTTATQNKVITDSEFQNYWRGDRTPQGQATGEAWGIALGKRFFHWFLEFPEIMAQGGFDCILGNPPYKGGQHLSGMYGYPFCEYVKWEYAPAGLSDLVAYFVRRIFNLLKPNGFTAFITTNSITDGNIRKDGLEEVIKQGGTINFAVRGIKWPGQAKLFVSLVAIHNGNWQRMRVLDGVGVPVITSYFEGHEDIGEPKRLAENSDQVFSGSNFLGVGFILTLEEMERLWELSPKYKDVVFPMLNGRELNSSPLQKPERSIINFFDWSLNRAKQYPETLQIVQEKVKPEREKLNPNTSINKHYIDDWWQYGVLVAGLYQKLEQFSLCFVAARTTKYLNFSSAPTSYIFTESLKVFTTDRWDLYAVVQSTLHEV